MMRALGYAALLVVALPVFLLVSMVVVSRLGEPGFEPVDLSDPPLDLAVLGAWRDDDGTFVCRAFYHRDLRDHSDSIPSLRYDVSETELELCVSSFQAFGRDGAWPREFDWERSGWRARVQRPDPADPSYLEVSYRSDEDRIADTRYRVDPATGEPRDFEFHGYFGPAQGLLGVVVGGVVGLSAWLFLLAYLLVRWVELRREERGTVRSGATRG